MKNFSKWTAISLFFCSLAVVNSSCNKDDEPNKDSKSKWVLTSMTCKQSIVSNEGVSQMDADYQFTYDKEGRMTYNGITEYNYTYEGNTIKCDDEGDITEYQLNSAGMVVSGHGKWYASYIFEYNNLNQLTSITRDKYVDNLYWSNGLITKIEAVGNSSYEYDQSISINTDCAKVLNAITYSIALDDYEPLFINGQLGVVPSVPISKEVRYKTQTVTYSYLNIDANGCPAKFVETYTQGSSTYSYTYDLKWARIE